MGYNWQNNPDAENHELTDIHKTFSYTHINGNINIGKYRIVQNEHSLES